MNILPISAALWQALAWRFLQSVVTLWLVTVLFFLITELSPGDFAIASATQGTTQAMIEATRYRLGLYDPLYQRYWFWLAGVLQGDLGTSWWASLPVAPLIGERLWHSAWLFCWAAAVTVPISLALAVLAAARQGGAFDRISSWTTLTAMSIPDFVIAYALIILLALKFRIFPVHTIFVLDMPITERLYASALPIMALAAVTITPMFRLSRAALINILTSDYIQMAELKGLGPARILLRHALPNVIGPIANAVVLALANLFFGLVIIEVIFSYPGLGSLVVIAASQQDMPLLLACAMISAVLFISLNLLADSIAIYFNPRLRFPANAFGGAQAKISWRSRMARRGIGHLGYAALAAIAVMLAWGGFKYWFGEKDYNVKITVVPAPMAGQRDKLLIADLLGKSSDAARFIHNNYFKSLGQPGPASHNIEGSLQVPAFKVRRRPAGGRGNDIEATFPAFQAQFIRLGEVLLPMERDRLLTLNGPRWSIILSTGRVWREKADGDWSRAAFPFTLVSQRGAGPHYGVATFAYNDKAVTQLRLQIAQETANWAQFDLWGQTAVKFTAGPVPGAKAARAAYERHIAQRLDVRPWSELAAQQWRSIEGFDGEGNRQNITVSGLMLDDVFYLRPCRTRAGPHPFCRQMRHGVFSITKTLGAAVSLLWLAKKFGPEVFDEKIVDHISIPARHDGWKNVTFRHALDMVTGIGNVVPERVEYYVEADRSPVARPVWMADGIVAKLNAVAKFRNYPWGPGEVFRYRTVDTLVLAAALQAYLKKKQGPKADIWQSVTRDVLQPLGIDRLPMRRAREPDGGPGVPMFGFGMYPTFEEVLKLTRLLQDHGRYKGKQLLHRGLAKRLVSSRFDRGYPNGWRTRWGEGHYELGIWLTPHQHLFGCKQRIPVMSGFGGNYVIVMPNRTIGLRFADGHDNNRYTWDSSGIRNTSDQIRSFCG